VNTQATYTAFSGTHWLCTGTLAEVLPAALKQGHEGVLIFEDQTGKQQDFDFRGTADEVVAKAAPAIEPRTGPGRPKLGVVSREISLLPRHWEWLELQPQGASAAIRRLVDQARQSDGGAAELRWTVQAIGRIMTTVAGNLPGFEEALRSLYANRFEELRTGIEAWPEGIRDYINQRLPVVSGVA
jgi:hypothetical protein